MGDSRLGRYTEGPIYPDEFAFPKKACSNPSSELSGSLPMHVCLFDIDGTLIDTAGAGKCAMEGALREAFGITAPTHGIPYAGRTDRAIAEDLFRYHGLEVTPERWDYFRDIYLELLKTCLPEKSGIVLPGIRQLIEHLVTQSQIVVGLLTGNVRDGAYRKLSHFSLDHHFSFGGFGDHHTDRDDVARSALREVGDRTDHRFHPDRLWVIGDTPADVRCGRAIGARTIAVATGTHTLDQLRETAPDHALADLSDFEFLTKLWS